jgi:septum formation protein
MIYLASQSPRRRQLLEQIGIEYKTLKVEVDESWDGKEPADRHVLRLALAKARTGWNQIRSREPSSVLGADTVVVLNGKILGKADTVEQAGAMLRQLSGHLHQVYSAVALIDAQGREHSVLNISQVSFHKLTDNEIESYCATGEPLGKAGGYAIQGRAAAFIERLQGSYSGVMGLPLFETAELLRKL